MSNKIKSYVKRPLCWVSIAVVIIMYMVIGDNCPYPEWNVELYNKKTITIWGKVCDKEVRNGQLKVYVKNVDYSIENAATNETRPDKLKGVVLTNLDEKYESKVKIGCTIEARGSFYAFNSPSNEGEFDARAYYYIRGYEGQIKRSRIITVSSRYNHLSERLRRVRNLCIKEINKYLDEEDSGIISAMLFADKSNLNTDIKEKYQNAGISHILALSGLHIAAIGLFVLKSLRKAGIGSKSAILISGVILILYCIMTGFSTSMFRAVIMFFLGGLATVIGRSYDILSAAALSAVIILFYNPLFLYDSGFLLSFCAIIGIACIFPVLDKMTDFNRGKTEYELIGTDNRNWKKRIYLMLIDKGQTLRQALLVSISVSIATFPVTVYSFYQITGYSVIINLIVIPLMSIVLATGFAGTVISVFGKVIFGAGKIALLNNGIIAVADFIFKITGGILKIYRFLCIETIETLDGVVIVGKPEKWRCFIFIACVILLLAALNCIGGLVSGDNRNDKSYVVIDHKKQRIINVRKLICSVSFFFFVFLCGMFMLHRKKGEVEIRNIYVGQGDCALISGRNMPTLMIDGGSSDIKSVYKYNMLPVIKANGIKYIDYCFISHFDSDHSNGIFEMLNSRDSGIVVKNLLVSEEMISKHKNEIVSACKGNNTKIYTIKSKDLLLLEEEENKCRLIIECLNPDRGHNNENDDSLVLKLIYETKAGDSGREWKPKFVALFTGDISSEVEKSLLNEFGECTYLKIAHHGSRYSTCDRFLREVNPKICVISSGVDNSYGHPHKETLERVSEYVPYTRLYRTDECGQVTVVVDNNISISRLKKNL